MKARSDCYQGRRHREFELIVPFTFRDWHRASLRHQTSSRKGALQTANCRNGENEAGRWSSCLNYPSRKYLKPYKRLNQTRRSSGVPQYTRSKLCFVIFRGFRISWQNGRADILHTVFLRVYYRSESRQRKWPCKSTCWTTGNVILVQCGRRARKRVASARCVTAIRTRCTRSRVTHLCY